MASTPPGWYDDGRGALRWWDGRQWTEHVQTPDPEPAIDPAPSASVDEQPAAGAPIEYPPSTPVEDPPSAPPGYPGGFPGGPAPSGGFIAATEPKKSKLWILWVVLGVVLLGVVIAAAVLIPLAIGLFGNAASGTGNGSEPSGADEAAAVAAVELYDDAWRTADCDAFIEATTQELRVALALDDCADFTEAADGFSSSVEDYTVTVTSVERDDDEITVQTSETYDSLYAEDGSVADEPIPTEVLYEYTVVPQAGGWVIDDFDTD